MSDPAPDVEFNVGVDVEDVNRFEADRVRLDALFSPAELADAAETSQATRLAGTWCTKEATVKALWPWVHLDLRRVSVSRDADGRPHVAVTGWDLAGAGVRVRASISHSGNVATAVVVAWGPPPAPGDAPGWGPPAAPDDAPEREAP